MADRLTIGSTGGPVSGQDESDRTDWQSNTKKLEASGAMGIEYSLSCPQGGDGTEGDMVSQNAELTAKITDWIMEIGDPDIPKLFKLTAAVTSIVPILRAIRGVLDRYPNKRAGITLANSFPTLAFRPSTGRRWEEGVVVGMSGERKYQASIRKCVSCVEIARVAYTWQSASMNMDISKQTPRAESVARYVHKSASSAQSACGNVPPLNLNCW